MRRDPLHDLLGIAAVLVLNIQGRVGEYSCSSAAKLVRADRFHRRLRWLQIKEKFGEGRFYWEMRGWIS